MCQAITSKFGCVDGATSLIKTVGLAGNPTLASAFHELAAFDEPVTDDELVELFDGGGRTVEALRHLDVIVERPEDGW